MNLVDNNIINMSKNIQRPVLHLIADIKLGEYYVSRNDEANKQEVHRKVTEEDQENFNKIVEKSRKKKIMKEFNLTKKEVKNVETIAYKTLEDFDRIHNTDYSKKYVKIVTMETKNSLLHRKHCEELKREELRKAGIVIDYNLPVMEGIVKNKHKMGIINKLKFIKCALKSRSNGATVNFKLNDENKKYGEILKNKIMKTKDNKSDVENEKIAIKKDKIPTMEKGKVNTENKERKTLKGIYRAAIISLGIFAAGAVGSKIGLKKSIESQSNKTQIESMIDINNSNLSDKQKDSITDKKIKDTKESSKASNTTNSKKENFYNSIVVKNINDKNNKKLKAERFSQIKVGSKFNLNSGKYFETSTGEGRVGSFEGQDIKPRVLSLIKITTKNGNNILIQDNDKNLYQLKCKYPNAQFSYHFTDVKGNAYGWVTSDSFAKSLKIEKSREQKEKKAKKYEEKDKDKDGFIPVEY